jgi:hypothetical protein
MTKPARGILTFYGATHQYFLDGVLIPSVTQILEDVGLTDYSSVPADVLAAAQERGGRVHEITRLYDLGDLDESNLNDITKGYLSQWVQFRKAWKIDKFIFRERPIHSQLYRYGVTPDCVADDKWNTVVEIKTGAPVRAVGPQTAAQDMAAREITGFKGRGRRVAVYLQPDSHYAVELTDRMDWNIFLSAKNVYHAKHPKS